MKRNVTFRDILLFFFIVSHGNFHISGFVSMLVMLNVVSDAYSILMYTVCSVYSVLQISQANKYLC